MYNNYRLFNIELSKIGEYAHYARQHSHELLNYIDYLIHNNAQTKRDIDLSIILDNRIHPILEDRDEIFKIVNYLDNINIFIIDDSETLHIENITSEMNKIIKHVEYLVESNNI